MEIAEEYVEQQILKDLRWNDEHSEELGMLRNAINMYLKLGNVKSLYELCSFFEDGTLIETFKTVPDIAYCIIGIMIMMKEFNMHYDELFFNDVYSITEVIEKINRYKFYLLDIEFNHIKEEKMKMLIDDLIYKKLSPVALLYLIKCSSVDSEYVLGQIMTYIDVNGYNKQYNELTEAYNNIFG